MREILFRGKRLDGRGWAEGDFVHDRLVTTNEPVWTIWYFDSDGKPQQENVAPETVGQYTGLRDKNEVKIFEGDVLKHETVFDERIYSVVFDEGAFCYFYNRNAIPFSDYEFGIDSEWVEVIGNIHDNPELLKGGGEG